jgi:Mn-containing catalase
MFAHNKRLQYTVRVSETNPGLANLMLEQFGGPQGELAAACRYFTQYLAEDDPGRRDMLIDIATEELSHLEVIGTIVAMLNKGAKGRMAEGLDSEAELFRSINGAGNDSHVTQVLYGAGPALTNSGGVPWTAAYIDTIGDPTCDLRSNIAAEARAKIIYERLINLTDDPGVKEALGFLMTREISHQQSFEKALYSMQKNFPPGKLPGMTEFENVYFNMSTGDGDARPVEQRADLRVSRSAAGRRRRQRPARGGDQQGGRATRRAHGAAHAVRRLGRSDDRRRTRPRQRCVRQERSRRVGQALRGGRDAPGHCHPRDCLSA